MRTSLKNIKSLEDYAFARGAAENRLVTEARLVLYPEWQQNLHAQQQTYHLVRLYGRRQLRKEIRNVEKKVFTRREYRSFRTRISRIFGL